MTKPKPTRSLSDNRPPVLVYDKAGKVLGTVSAQATSVAASKIAKGAVEFSRRFGTAYGWVRKE